MGLAAPLLGFIAFIVAVGIYGSFAFVEKGQLLCYVFGAGFALMGVEIASLLPFHPAFCSKGRRERSSVTFPCCFLL